MRGEGGAEDCCKQLFGVGVFEVSFVATGYGRAERREDDDIRGVFFEDLREAAADGGGHFEEVRYSGGGGWG